MDIKKCPVSSDNESFVFNFCGTDLMLQRSSCGAWRILGRRKDTDEFDLRGAGQILASDLGEKPLDGTEKLALTETESTYTIFEDGGKSVRIYKDENRIEFCGKDGRTCLSAICAESAGDDFSIVFKVGEKERFYGTGERFNALNQRGKHVNLMAVDEWCRIEGNSYCPIPILVSSGGYGLFFNRYEQSEFDICAKTPDRLEMIQHRAPLDLYVFAPEEPSKILYGYSMLTGFAPKPEDWYYGTQICRYHPEFSLPEGIFAMADAMKQNDFPWDAVILEGWPAFNVGRYDELKEVADKLHADGKKVMMYHACGRMPNNYIGDFGMTEDDAVRRTSDGATALPDTDSYNPADAPVKNRSRYIDITNPDALDRWYNNVWGRLMNDIKIDGAKIDFCEQFPDHFPLTFHDGRSENGAHHWYPTLYNSLMKRFMSQNKGGGMCLSRGGGIGAQRYPFMWAGDQRREFRYLKSILTGVLSAGMSGVPFMSFDMAGYRFAKEEDRPANPENIVFVRGLQYTCFSANIQTHGLVTRPYDFADDVKNLYRLYSKLHYALIPYISEQGKIACETGMPLMRALYLYDPADENVYDIDDEYMLGEGILVAPVLENTDRRDIYLPKGQWQNIFSGEMFEGGTFLRDFYVPINKIAAFRLVSCTDEKLDECLAVGREFICAINNAEEKLS